MEKVMIDCERMKYPFSGLAHFCRNLVNKIVEKSANEIDYTIFLPKDLKGCFGNKANYITVNPLHKLVLPAYRNTIWHATSQVKNYQPAGKNIKKILTIHDLNFLIEKDSAIKIKKLLNNIQNKIDNADYVSFISEFTLNQTKEHLNLGDKITKVIYNGSEIDVPEILSEPIYVPTKKFLFTIGTILEKKNFHTLPSTIKNLDIELLIAGDICSPNYKNIILNEAKKHGVDNRVKIIGPINHNDKCWYYKNCLAFAFPSLAEGFGLPPAEAMRFGKPIFLSKHTSLPEIGGNAAYYFNSFDAEEMAETLENGLHDFEKNNKTIEILEQSKKFSWTNAADEYIDIYKMLSK
ncbi:glycosyltransferase family 4 protein [Pedobacter alpinus]|uniref:Glycosyltransferase family 4 protein n=1 Tax=Pedobacter alpinus TaxID=1590643 RepID=A0ABW5TXC4_9SPHI